jgi:hypothetical protein
LLNPHKNQPGPVTVEDKTVTKKSWLNSLRMKIITWFTKCPLLCWKKFLDFFQQNIATKWFRIWDYR